MGKQCATCRVLITLKNFKSLYHTFHVLCLWNCVRNIDLKFLAFSVKHFIEATSGNYRACFNMQFCIFVFVFVFILHVIQEWEIKSLRFIVGVYTEIILLKTENSMGLANRDPFLHQTLFKFSKLTLTDLFSIQKIKKQIFYKAHNILYIVDCIAASNYCVIWY